MTSKPKTKTGTVIKTKSGKWQGVVTLNDGSRKRLRPFDDEPNMSKERARERVRAYIERNPAVLIARPKRPKGPPIAGGEGAAWWDKYLAHRDALGLSPVLHAFRPHIKPFFGDKHPRDWTPQLIEKFVGYLDGKIAAKEIAWKTASNVWGLLTKSCKVACSAKASTGLRVRVGNPCAGIEGPERGDDKEKQWLYPFEFERLISCPTVPKRWRLLYTLLAYTYMRPNELRPLLWSDVNFEIADIHITKAWEEKQKKIGPPKTRAGVRHIPIEPELLPLLKALHSAAGGQGSVYPRMPPREAWAKTFRGHLLRAGVTRADLHTTTETTKQITMYDLRASGITWRALRKDYGSEIQEAAGHEKYDTTDGYIRKARVLAGKVGAPFPPLPDGFVSQIVTVSSQPVDIAAIQPGSPPCQKSTIQQENSQIVKGELLDPQGQSEAKCAIVRGVTTVTIGSDLGAEVIRLHEHREPELDAEIELMG
jgi:integrase